MTHDRSLAFYFDDPEGNMIEVYWPTDTRTRQPLDNWLDLTAPDDGLVAQAIPGAVEASRVGTGATDIMHVPDSGPGTMPGDRWGLGYG